MKFIEADSASEVDLANWPWVNFKPSEFACKSTGKLKIAIPLVNALQTMRREINKPFMVVSGYRSPEHNAKVGGAKHSKHMEGTAVDISMVGHDPHLFERVARRAGFLGFGFYPENNFMHIDLGPKREWGTRW